MSDWRDSVQALSAESPRRATTRLGLYLELREETRRRRGTWSPPTAKTATAREPDGVYRLAARPVRRSDTGNWVRGDLGWTTLGYQLHRLSLDPAQVRWFAQFAALHRATRDADTMQEPEWLWLDDFESPLLWPLLAEAETLGIALVSGKRATEVTLGSRATLALDATMGRGGLELLPVVDIDGTVAEAASVGLVGDHGAYLADLDPPRFTLAPLDRPATPELLALLSARERMRVPADDAPEFLRDYYPRLASTVTVASTDGSVELPEVVPASLLLTVEFLPRDRVELTWQWEQGVSRSPARGNEPAGTLAGVDAAVFVAQQLPLLERRTDLRVETVGERPAYREVSEAPRLTITTVPTDRNDWFDLGVLVEVNGHEVPFSAIFTAIARGRSKILLVDKSYLDLEQPVFQELRRLIEEASELGEWEPHPQISRYQASLWWEFEELADETREATAWRASVEGLKAAMDEVVPLPAGLTAELRPYQREGFQWLATLWRHRLGGVLADDMGLGKTLQALALMAHAVETGAEHPFLVVAPTSVVPNWEAEARRFTSLRVQTIASRTTAIDPRAHVVVTSYALLRLDIDRYKRQPWAGLVLDEAQFVKNRDSKVHQAAAELAAPFTLAITGTPMENSLLDLWAILHLTSPGLFASRTRFTEYFQVPIESGSTSRMHLLRTRIRPFLLRRTKDAVAPELPEKQEQVLQIDLEPRHRALYDRYLQQERRKILGLVDDLDRQRFIVFRSLTLLRMLALDATLIDPEYADVPSSKLDALMEQVDDVVAEGHRALVFSQFTSYLSVVGARLERAGVPFEYLDGSTLGRADVIRRFREGDAPLFLISLKAGGFGLTLTEADYVFLLDPWWNPAAENQAVDRTHRIGQGSRVNVYRLVARDTIEEKVMALRDAKARMFDAVMDADATFASALTADDIRELLS